MIQLLALRAFIPVWARAISLSDRLSEKTWKFLVVLQCVIFILSAGGFREARLSAPVAQATSVISAPPRIESEPVLTSDLRRPAGKKRRKVPRALATKTQRQPRRKSRHDLTALVAAQRFSILHREYAKPTERLLVVTSFLRTPAQQTLGLSRMKAIDTFEFANVDSVSASNTLSLVADALRSEPSPEFSNTESRHVAFSGFDLLPGLGKFVEPSRSISVQLPQINGGDSKQVLLFWLSLFGMIVSSVGTVSTAVVAWISVHRSRADALLKELQIEKMRLEVEKLRVELEQARLEAERRRSPIIIAAG